jgi:tetratricopeptide (TPR) repeat protein
VPAQVELLAGLATLAAVRADWDAALAAADRSVELAEREGIENRLGLPYALQGLIHWRDGELEESARMYRRAHELAKRVDWSELAFQTLFGLAVSLRDAGELSEAVTALDQAVDVCERAGLIAQSIQATSQRAVVLWLADRPEAAREAAAEAAELAQRLNYPLGRVAALEARGVTDPDPKAGAALLVEAAQGWAELERPLEAARCRMLAGQSLAATDPERSRELLEQAAEETERLGVPHLAARARALAAG